VRERIDVREERPEKEWPLARTRYQLVYLDASNGSLKLELVAKQSAVSYDATSVEPHAVFSYAFSVTRNAGTHVIHTGGKYDSHILVPVIPG